MTDVKSNGNSRRDMRLDVTPKGNVEAGQRIEIAGYGWLNGVCVSNTREDEHGRTVSVHDDAAPSAGAEDATVDVCWRDGFSDEYATVKRQFGRDYVRLLLKDGSQVLLPRQEIRSLRVIHTGGAQCV